jgi:hypothetical protein
MSKSPIEGPQAVAPLSPAQVAKMDINGDGVTTKLEKQVVADSFDRNEDGHLDAAETKTLRAGLADPSFRASSLQSAHNARMAEKSKLSEEGHRKVDKYARDALNFAQDECRNARFAVHRYLDVVGNAEDGFKNTVGFLRDAVWAAPGNKSDLAVVLLANTIIALDPGYDRSAFESEFADQSEGALKAQRALIETKEAKLRQAIDDAGTPEEVRKLIAEYSKLELRTAKSENVAFRDLLLDHVRRRGQHIQCSEGPDGEPTYWTAEFVTMRADAHDIAAALNNLPPNLREPVVIGRVRSERKGGRCINSWQEKAARAAGVYDDTSLFSTPPPLPR